MFFNPTYISKHPVVSFTKFVVDICKWLLNRLFCSPANNESIPTSPESYPASLASGASGGSGAAQSWSSSQQLPANVDQYQRPVQNLSVYLDQTPSFDPSSHHHSSSRLNQPATHLEPISQPPWNSNYATGNEVSSLFLINSQVLNLLSFHFVKDILQACIMWGRRNMQCCYFFGNHLRRFSVVFKKISTAFQRKQEKNDFLCIQNSQIFGLVTNCGGFAEFGASDRPARLSERRERRRDESAVVVDGGSDGAGRRRQLVGSCGVCYSRIDSVPRWDPTQMIIALLSPYYVTIHMAWRFIHF